MVNNMNNLTLDLVKRTSKVVLPDNLIFGRNFTDHYFEMDYSPAEGWHNATIKPFGTFPVSPATMVFHYGQAIFEGMKAYHQVNGKIAMFRPEKNFARLNRSAIKMCIPQIDEKFALEALKKLVEIEKDWIPTQKGFSLYIRPLIFGCDPILGVHPSANYKFMMFLSPVGPYYPQGFKPVPIYVTDKYVRAAKKGLGDCKTAANYAASFAGQAEANKQGYSQVLWLDGIEQKYLEEVGAMNIFVRFKDEVTTPMLSGSILAGVTRMSCLEILKDWKYNTTERTIALQELLDGYKNGNLVEMFGTGTAAIISGVSKLKFNDTILQFNEEKAGEISTKLYNELIGIQFGEIEDRFGWMTYID